MADSLPLGKLIDDTQQRDAIHIAVAPVVANEKLAPGQDIGFVTSSTERVGVSPNPIGIVDPFLRQLVFPEQRFWMFLYPQTVTGMRHHWSHPAFEATVPIKPLATEEARQWLEAFALRHRFDWSEMIHAAQNGGFITAHGYDLHGADELGHEHEEFWENLESFLGRAIGPSMREQVCWTCSC